MFSIDTSKLPSIRSYRDAKIFWERQNKSRSSPTRAPRTYERWSSEAVPLRDWRSPHLSLVVACAYPNSAPDYFELCLYGAPLVVYYADGTVQINGHGSRSSVAFTRCFLPPGVDLERCYGSLWLSYPGRDGQKYHPIGANTLTLDPLADRNGFQLRNITRSRNCAIIKRREATKVLKAIKPLIEWKTGVDRLSGTHLPPSTLVPFSFPKDYFTDPNCWYVFASYAPDDIKSMAAQSFGVITLKSDQEGYPNPQPSRTWLEKLPLLRNYDEVEFV